MFQCACLIAQAKYSTSDEEAVSDEEPDPTSVIYVSKRGVMRGVSPEEIIGVRSAGNYSEIWLGDGSSVLDSRPLGIWAGILPASVFFSHSPHDVHKRAACIGLGQKYHRQMAGQDAWHRSVVAGLAILSKSVAGAPGLLAFVSPCFRPFVATKFDAK